MFSASVEMLLHVAYREATTRRHAHLTLEHLLYVLAHDLEGERILAACGADLPRLRRELDSFLQGSVEQYPRGMEKEPEQTRAFRRVLQTAVLHVQSAGKSEVNAGDIVAAVDAGGTERKSGEVAAVPARSGNPEILAFAEIRPPAVCLLTGERLDVKFKTSDLLFVSYQIGYATYNFETMISRISPDGRTLVCLYPRVMFYSEKRAERRITRR